MRVSPLQEIHHHPDYPKGPCRRNREQETNTLKEGVGELRKNKNMQVVKPSKKGIAHPIRPCLPKTIQAIPIIQNIKPAKKPDHTP